jgi:sarcosine oxidase subunit gamma
VPREDRIGTITITEILDQALASVATRLGQEEPLRAALNKALKLTLPEIGKSTVSGPFSACWTGPEQWMISASHKDHELLAQELKAAVGQTASVVEQTDGWCRFDLSGAALFDLMERLTKAPVRDMSSGDVIRSTVEHLGVFLWCLDETRMAVIAPRSSAGSLHHALVTAAKSIA